MFVASVGTQSFVEKTREALEDVITEWIHANIAGPLEAKEQAYKAAMATAKEFAVNARNFVMYTTPPSYLEVCRLFVMGPPSASDSDLKRAVRDLLIERDTLIVERIDRQTVGRIGPSDAVPFVRTCSDCGDSGTVPDGSKCERC